MKKVIIIFVILLGYNSLIHAENSIKPNGSSKTFIEALKNKKTSSTKVHDPYLKEYISTAYQEIHNYWKLPEYEQFDEVLESVVVITIKNNGNIIDYFFEKKSSNNRFNILVLKAILEADPLPPFPKQLNKDTVEIGLRFKPGN